MLKRTTLAKSLLLAFSGTAVMVGSPAFAQQDAPAPVELQRVEITGSAIKRIDAETALPVQIITREQIQKTGVQNVEQLLQTISATSSSGGLTSSSASGATTGGISAFSIHGLGSQRTLILINGRRVSPYGVGFTNDSVSVDVNSIPLAAIERVEVLKDGASATYGSDAIAGVINFILRRDFKGVEVTGEYGDPTQGGASVAKGSALFGFGEFEKDRYNIMAMVSLQKEKALFGRDRSFAKSDIDTVHLQDTTSGNTFPANFVPVDGSFGSRNPTAATGCVSPYSVLDPLKSQKACRFDPAPMVALIPDSERISFFTSGRLALPNEMELYGEASINQNKIHTVIQPVPLSDQFNFPATNPLANQYPYNAFGVSPLFPVAAIVLTKASPYYPTAFVASQGGVGSPDLLIRYRSAITGPRDLTDISTSPRVVLGLKGVASGWDWDTNVLYSQSNVREQVNGGYPQYTKILPLLNSGQVNFFGANTAAIDSQLMATGFTGNAFEVKQSIASLSGKASKEVYQLPGGAVGLALGFEVRKETYNYQSDTALQIGDVSGYGGNLLPLNKSRNVSALFSELVVPIVKNLEADLALRYDNYQGIGSSWTPKVGVRWQPVEMLVMRGSWGEGFRAASLQDLYANNTQSVTPAGVDDILRCPTTHDAIKDCGTQFSTTFGGNSALKAETSKNATLGFVLQPTKSFSMGVDYFQVAIKNTIVNGVDQGSILADPVKYSQYIIRGAVDPAYPTLPGPIATLIQTNLNLGETKVAGYEIDLRWTSAPSEFGRFGVGLNSTYYTKYDTQNPDGSFTNGIDQVNTSTGGVVPRYKQYLAVDWTLAGWNVNLAQNFQKGYDDTPGNVDPNAIPHRVDNYITYDAQASYFGLKSWRFTLGVRNLLNTDPPYVNTNAAFQAGYDPQYADPRGRYVYGRVTYAF